LSVLECLFLIWSAVYQKERKASKKEEKNYFIIENENWFEFYANSRYIQELFFFLVQSNMLSYSSFSVTHYHCYLSIFSLTVILNKKALSWKSVFDWYSNKMNVVRCRHIDSYYNMRKNSKRMRVSVHTKKAILANQCFCINHNMLYPEEDYAISTGISILFILVIFLSERIKILAYKNSFNFFLIDKFKREVFEWFTVFELYKQ